MMPVMSVVDVSVPLTFAVVHWFNYRKEKSAGFKGYFVSYEEARKYAYKQAVGSIDTSEISVSLLNEILKEEAPTSEWNKDLVKKVSSEEYIITESEITDGNGGENPYNSLIGYGNSSNGYCAMFFSVVKSFDGVENSWSECEDEECEEEECENECKWVPKY